MLIIQSHNFSDFYTNFTIYFYFHIITVPIRRRLGYSTDDGRHRHVIVHGREFTGLGNVFWSNDEHVH